MECEDQISVIILRVFQGCKRITPFCINLVFNVLKALSCERWMGDVCAELQELEEEHLCRQWPNVVE